MHISRPPLPRQITTWETGLHTHIHTCIHTCIHEFQESHPYPRVSGNWYSYTHTHTCMHKWMNAYIHTIYRWLGLSSVSNNHRNRSSYIHTYIHTYIHKDIHTYMSGFSSTSNSNHQLVFTHTHIHTYIHTHRILIHIQ
jgi:hypothetical protein